MKQNTISTKIKFIGILFIVLMISIIATTFYLNEKNKKDALIINIAGKERMLTQNISKNIFYLYQNKNASYLDLDSSTLEFIYNLNSLKDGNSLIGISKAPTAQIKEQLLKVETLWNSFHKNIEDFKNLVKENDKNNEMALKNIVISIYDTNIPLLTEVDDLVSMYTNYSEQKSDFIEDLQYIFALFIMFLIFYSFLQLKSMEENVKKFFDESRKIMEDSFNEPLRPIKIEAEEEIIEATDTINCFINKINSAMTYSANAIEQSNNASVKLEEITEEFDKIIDELNNSADISKQLNKSEDIVIQSQENLMNSTKKLQELKNELDKLMNFCKTK